VSSVPLVRRSPAKGQPVRRSLGEGGTPPVRRSTVSLTVLFGSRRSHPTRAHPFRRSTVSLTVLFDSRRSHPTRAHPFRRSTVSLTVLSPPPTGTRQISPLPSRRPPSTFRLSLPPLQLGTRNSKLGTGASTRSRAADDVKEPLQPPSATTVSPLQLHPPSAFHLPSAPLPRPRPS